VLHEASKTLFLGFCVLASLATLRDEVARLPHEASKTLFLGFRVIGFLATLPDEVARLLNKASKTLLLGFCVLASLLGGCSASPHQHRVHQLLHIFRSEDRCDFLFWQPPARDPLLGYPLCRPRTLRCVQCPGQATTRLSVAQLPRAFDPLSPL
jgi:hypothetical protein